VRRRPYAVILFDEIEKAHPDVFNVLLQILDDGRVTDGQGRTVDFTNTVLILTSNIGSSSILDLAGDPARHLRDGSAGRMKPCGPLPARSSSNRLDETIIFHSLKPEELRQIVELQVQRLAKRLEDKKLGLELDADALDWLAGVGYDPVYGARPLKRAIQRELETPIAKGILAASPATPWPWRRRGGTAVQPARPRPPAGAGLARSTQPEGVDPLGQLQIKAGEASGVGGELDRHRLRTSPVGWPSPRRSASFAGDA
jgi:hypothetical protein